MYDYKTQTCRNVRIQNTDVGRRGSRRDNSNLRNIELITEHEGPESSVHGQKIQNRYQSL